MATIQRVGVQAIGLLLICMAVGAARANEPGAPSPSHPTHQLDKGHTSIYWEVLHMGTSTTRGRFDQIDGKIVFKPARQQLDVEIVIQAASVSTGSPTFDAILKGPRLLTVADHPTAVFKSQYIRWEGTTPKEVTGLLSLSGIDKPLSLKVIRWKCGFNPLFRTEVCGGDLEATLLRSEFGLGWGAPWVADEVRLAIQVEAVARTTERAPDSQ